MDHFEWEERYPDTPLWIHIAAGSSAGVSEHLAMLPLDNIKTHCQAGSRLSLPRLAAHIYRSGGFPAFYSGSTVLMAGCIPAHAVYFSIYEAVKSLEITTYSAHTQVAFAGFMSALFHDLIMTPTEAIKQRLQLVRSHQGWLSTRSLVAEVLSKEGPKAFYRSLPVNLALNLPFSSLLVVVNEWLQSVFGGYYASSSLNYYLCGSIAGSIASIPTCPLDVLKTRLNTQQCINATCYKKTVCESLNPKPFNNNEKSSKFILSWLTSPRRQAYTFQSSLSQNMGVKNIIGTIWREEGIKGFFKGLKLRMAIQGVSSGVAWGTYGTLRDFLRKSHFE